MSLPFELPKEHKGRKKAEWKYLGMKFTNEDFEMYIYPEYIKETHCDLCNNKFESIHYRQLDHNHTTGEIRNIVCKSCNLKKYDRKKNSNNTSGYTGICKSFNKQYKKGFIYKFCANGKSIKHSTNFDWLVKFAENWKIENNYET